MECNMDCGFCKDWKCRCSDCFALVETKEVEWFCDLIQKPCKDVEACHVWEDD